LYWKAIFPTENLLFTTVGAVALKAEKLDISDFLEKPFSRTAICDALKKALGSTPAADAAPVPQSQPVEQKRQNVFSKFFSRS
jgi:FixJ family two-component response regulator